MSEQRPFDIVVYGATGFTGGLVVEYLARQAPSHMRWAIAGRDARRLQGIRQYLETLVPDRAPVGIIEAESGDFESLVTMAARTRVLLSTVGPYIEHGDSVVRACIAARTDYLDITGESDFVDYVVATCGESARAAGVRVVNCCGFDSIPADLGVLFTVERLPEGVPVTIEGFIEYHGSISGGTWRSAIAFMSRWRELSKHRPGGGAEDLPEGRRVRLVKPSVHYEPRIGGWAYPLPTIDPYVVRRSARALARYGPDFRYSHHWVEPRLEGLAVKALGAGAVFVLSQFGPTRERLLDLRPAGAGPTAEQRATNWFKATFFAQAGDTRLVTRVSGGDPGYSETAKMAGESAMCLALDELPESAGVMTTAMAMGRVLIERLQTAGLRFDVLEGPTG